MGNALAQDGAAVLGAKRFCNLAKNRSVRSRSTGAGGSVSHPRHKCLSTIAPESKVFTESSAID